MKNVLTLDYIVVIVYMLISLGVGFYFMRFNKNAADFFRGKNKIPWLVSGLSAFMTGFSAWTFTGAAGIAYEDGIIVILLYVGNAVTFLFGWWLFAVRWRRSRVSSPMEYLSDRFNNTTRQTFALSTAFFDMFMVAVWLFALSEFVSAATHISIQLIIIVSAVIILLYCLLGGLWAVVITDFIQGIILLPFTLILAYITITKFGGISQFISALPSNMLTIGHSEYSSWFYLLSWTVMVIFGYNTRAHAQRYFSVDVEKSAKKISILNFVLFLFGALIWFIPPMAARVLYPNIAALWPSGTNPHEGAYAIISIELLPHGLIGIMLAAIFSASMSSISGFYNLYASVLSTDVLPRFFKGPLDDKKSLLVGRLTTLFLGILVPIIALVMSVSGESSFSLLMTFNSIISIAYGPPALIGLLKKTPHWTGIAYFVAAVILGSVGWFFLGWDLPQNVIYVIPLSVVIMFGGGWLSKFFYKENESYIRNQNRFFEKLNTPIDPEKEVGPMGDIQFTVFNFLAKVTALFAVFCLIFIAFNPIEQSSTVILYSGVTLAIAISLYILGKRNKAASLRVAALKIINK